MKKILLLSFCIFSLAAQANTVKPKKNKPVDCLISVTLYGTVSYTCMSTGAVTKIDIQATASDPDCTQAKNYATEQLNSL